MNMQTSAKKAHSGKPISKGLSRLTVEAIKGVTDVVESLSQTIAGFGEEKSKSSGISGSVYDSIRNITEFVGDGIDTLLDEFGPLLDKIKGNESTEAVVSALNGVLGDHLVARENPLAIPMQFRKDGKPLDQKALTRFVKKSDGHILVLVHGSCMNDLQWSRGGHDHGKALAKDLGFAPLYLHYNTGLHVSQNGRQFSQLMESLIGEKVKPQSLTILAHSMGGLVARSACHYGMEAGHNWVDYLANMVFLGTPHHGAPLEKSAVWIDHMLEFSPFSAPFARLGKIRSAGITDLRYGYILDEHWEGRDRFQASGDIPVFVPLPDQVDCFGIAARTSKDPGLTGDHLLGDGLVPVYSALGRHPDRTQDLCLPKSHQWIGSNMNHFDLLNHPGVYKRLKVWLKPG